jgi:hypothetical protein
MLQNQSFLSTIISNYFLSHLLLHCRNILHRLILLQIFSHLSQLLFFFLHLGITLSRMLILVPDLRQSHEVLLVILHFPVHVDLFGQCRIIPLLFVLKLG